MHATARSLWMALIALTLTVAGGGAAFAAGPLTINLPDAGSGYIAQDDDIPDVTARVARISFIRGEAQIRRAGVDEWEVATLNLPVVEGDEIATGDGRIELQFDIHTHVRLAENSYLKIATLKDEGIAVSLPTGTFSVKITTFDKDKTFFEADAPGTTFAVQRSGTYRIDAGQEGGNEIRLSADDGGEARIYSENAGFTLKNGRSVRLFIDGSRAGEWESGDLARYQDEFDEWTEARDEMIAKRLADAYYDRYYDQDIYGAEDLNGYGQWVHSADYGYVWRPFISAISVYADWSPYRYGHWRWMPLYGWTWVNDEPWGWATYHHGRWIYDRGYWVWSPYGYYRTSRSWWFPALVVFNVYNNNYCWYPLPYRHRYRHYNWGHGGHHNNGGHNNLPTGGVKPIPPVRVETGGVKPPKTDKVPPSAVVTVGVDDFGTTVKAFKKAPPTVAAAVLEQDPAQTTVQLPARKASRSIVVDKPAVAVRQAPTTVGAAPRKGDTPLDKDLLEKRVFGGRAPIEGTEPVRTTSPIEVRQPRKTGAVERPPVVKQNDTPPVRQAPVYTAPPVSSDPPPVRVPRRDPTPVRTEPAPVRTTPTPVRTPPAPVRTEPAPTRQPPRTEPAPVKVRPRDTTPVRVAPQPTRQPKRDPAPVKSEPKPERKPSKPSASAAG